jgi:hypothetical protein
MSGNSHQAQTLVPAFPQVCGRATKSFPASSTVHCKEQTTESQVGLTCIRRPCGAISSAMCSGIHYPCRRNICRGFVAVPSEALCC